MDAGTWRIIAALMVVLGVLDLVVHGWLNRMRPRATWRRTVIIGTLGIVTGVVFFVGADVIAGL
jgi:uncharacterized membrane protein HdeD (DUF308 family)